jgi:type I restriction enzyme S subunit
MAVKTGYKQTEIGVIPEDWEVKPLREIGNFKNGINKGSEDFGYGFPFVNLLDVFGVSCISANTELGLVNSNRIEQSIYNLQQGDVLFVRSSVKPEGVGLTTLVTEDIPKTVYSGFLIRFRSNNLLDLRYKEFVFYEEGFRNRLIAGSTVSANTNVNQTVLGALILAFPPTLAEQRAIAAALSEVDDQIKVLDDLIAKKRDLKQGAMQRLLTGEERLPGFSGAWEVKKIGEFTISTAGGTPSTLIDTYWGGDIKWMSSGELHLRQVYDVEGRITEKGLENSSTRLIPPRCVLIGLAGQGKTRGTVAINMVELCTNQSVAAIYPSNNFVTEYLYYNLDMRYEELRNLSTGDGGRGGLNLTIINAIDVPFPEKNEQTAIAAVLSDMDAEISTLEEEREKIVALKQGMMQELLTGQTRLV